MAAGDRGGGWPLLKQIARGDLLGFGDTARSKRTAGLRPRTERADRVVGSVCPYCAVGCAQKVFVEGGRITNIEGDEDSPISLGALCPKGAATYQLVNGTHRHRKVLHRRPYSRTWEEIDLVDAMDRVARHVKRVRDARWEEEVDGRRVRRTLHLAHLGGATLDIEENYLIKKLMTALGAIQVENQARI